MEQLKHKLQGCVFMCAYTGIFTLENNVALSKAISLLSVYLEDFLEVCTGNPSKNVYSNLKN